MKKLTIGFSKARSKWAVISWLIRKVEGSAYSHVYVKFHSDSLERDLVYQASKTMVNFMGTEVFNEEAETVETYTLDLSDEAYKHILQYAIDNAGKPYGVKALLGMGLVKLMGLFGKKIKNPFKDGSSAYVCLELVGVILWIIGEIESIEDLESMGLKEFHDLFMKGLK